MCIINFSLLQNESTEATDSFPNTGEEQQPKMLGWFSRFQHK